MCRGVVTLVLRRMYRRLLAEKLQESLSSTSQNEITEVSHVIQDAFSKKNRKSNHC